MSYKQEVDLYFNGAGDFAFDADRRDFLDTSRSPYRGLMQRVMTHVMSRKGDWRLEKTVGADIYKFLGALNTREIGELLRQAVYQELATSRIIRPNDIDVDVVPIAQNEVAIIIVVTPPNSTQTLLLNFSYNLKDNLIIPRNL